MSLIRRHLLYKLIIAFGAVLIAPISVLTLYYSVRFSDVLRENARNTALQQLLSEANELETQLSQTMTDVLFLSQSQELRRYSTQTSRAVRSYVEISDLLTRFMRRSPSFYHEVCLLDAQGMQQVCVYRLQNQLMVAPSDALRDAIDASYYRGALSLLELNGLRAPVYVSPVEWQVLHGRELPSANVAYSTMLMSNEGALAGVLVIDLDLEVLFGDVMNAHAKDRLTVIDETGRLVYRYDNVLSMRYPDVRYLPDIFPQSAETVMGQPQGVIIASPDASADMIVFARVRPREQALQWTLLISQSLALVDQPVVTAIGVTILVSAALLGLAVLFAAWVARRIVRPIDQLVQASQQLEQGEWSASIPLIRTSDEIGTLGRAFSRMAGKLSDTFRDLQCRIVELESSRQQILRHSQEIEALREITQAVGSTLNLQELYQHLLTHLQKLVPYTSSSIFLWEHERLRFVAHRGFPDDMDWNTIEEALSAKTLTKYNDFTAIVFADVNDVADWVHFEPLKDKVRSWMGVPIHHRGKLLGYLNLDHTTPNIYTPDYAALATSVARQAAVAIENARLFNNIEQAVYEQTSELLTERERLNAIVENVEDAILFTDQTGKVLYLNPAWEALTGYSRKELLNRSVRHLSDSLGTITLENVRSYLETHRVWMHQARLRRKDASQYEAESTVICIRDEQGQARYYVAVQRDITQAKELEALKARFVADAAHDLRNPISVLSTNLYLLKRAPAQLPQRLPMLEYQVERLNALIRDLLTIARLDRDQDAQMEFQPLDLAYLARQVGEAQATLAHQKRIHLKLDVPERACFMLGDVQQVERVLVNLVANALIYTPEGGQVELSLHCLEQTLKLVVSDNGIGIATEDLPHIFERFYRASNARKTSEGTGLGLAIVQEIVKRHDGAIQVHSELDAGTQFVLTFPQTEVSRA